MNTDIHPELRGEALQAGLFFLGGVLAGLVIFIAAIILTWQGVVSHSLDRLATAAILIATGGIAFGLIFTSRYLLAVHLGCLRQASRILGTSIGEKRRMDFSGAGSPEGTVVELFPPNGSSTPEQGESVKLILTRWKIPPAGQSTVDVHRLPGNENRLVVIRSDRRFLFGYPLSEEEAHRAAWRRKRIILGFASLGVLFLLAIFAYQLWRTANFHQTYLQAGQSRQWPAAEGKLSYAFARESDETTGNKNKKKPQIYEAALRYDYTVAGRVHTGERLFFGYRGTDNRADAEAVVQRYKKTTPLRVRYNPANPAESVLEPGHQEDLLGQLWGMRILMAFSILAILAAVVICASGLKEMGKPPEPPSS